MKKTRWSLGIVAGILGAALFALPVAAASGTVTSGSLAPFAAGIGTYDSITGSARMIRTTTGETRVVVRVSGLVPGETYGSHVHAQACADGDAGSHYHFDAPVRGGALDGTEIWPGPFTANASGEAFGQTVVGAIAGPTAVSVVIHSSTSAKIACADLS
jgi:Cu-Zn family superoxide dismutase